MYQENYLFRIHTIMQIKRLLSLGTGMQKSFLGSCHISTAEIGMLSNQLTASVV
jgi:hypothetical protein